MTTEDLQASNVALSGEVQRTQQSLKIALLTIDKLKLELAYLRLQSLSPRGRPVTCPAQATALKTKRPIRSARSVCRYKKCPCAAHRNSGFWPLRPENRL